MTRIGLPVPPGFTITTEVCTYFYAHKRSLPEGDAGAGRRRRCAAWKKSWARNSATRTRCPCFVSVRSGARDSMPGMMDTDSQSRPERRDRRSRSRRATNNERFAWDCYRRFIQMYGDVVMGVQKRPDEDHEPFETVIHELKHERHEDDVDDTKLSIADLKELVRRFKHLVKDRTGKQFPNDPWRAARGFDRRRVRFVDERPRDCLSPQIQHPPGMGHGRQRAGHGLWQHRRPIPDRASLSRAIRRPAKKFSTANF